MPVAKQKAYKISEREFKHAFVFSAVPGCDSTTSPPALIITAMRKDFESVRIEGTLALQAIYRVLHEHMYDLGICLDTKRKKRERTPKRKGTRL